MTSNSTIENSLDLAPNSTPEIVFEITIRILGQLESGIQSLSEEQYSTAKDPDASKNSPIGGHVRHVIEFYQALLITIEDPNSHNLSYDKRQRNLLFESNRDAALLEIEAIKTQVAALPLEDVDLNLSSIVDPKQHMFSMRTTLFRELVYLLDHMIHHMALIKLLAKEQNVALGSNFGLAQSTRAHQTMPAQ